MNYDDSGTEFLLMELDDSYQFGFMNLSDDMTFASETSIIREPDVFIADTGTMSDTTQFLYGLENVKEVIN